jgi:hypothetical protein
MGTFGFCAAGSTIRNLWPAPLQGTGQAARRTMPMCCERREENDTVRAPHYPIHAGPAGSRSQRSVPTLGIARPRCQVAAHRGKAA